jgi:ABC-type dipeptide/oligopeptide/nickel transport system ATPase component
MLEVQGLHVEFPGQEKPVHAVRGISFEVKEGETVALVGESGSGKSVTALSILQLLPYPRARHPAGSVRFRGTEPPRPAGLPGRHPRAPERDVRPRRCPVRHARRHRPPASRRAAHRWRPHPPAAGLRGGRGASHRSHARRCCERRPNLRARRPRHLHPARAGRLRAASHRQAAPPRAAALRRRRDAGAPARASAQPAAHDEPG